MAFINTTAEAKQNDHFWVRNEKDKFIELGFLVGEFSITNMDRRIKTNTNNQPTIYLD